MCLCGATINLSSRSARCRSAATRPSRCQVRTTYISRRSGATVTIMPQPIVWVRGTLRFCLCPLPSLTMRPGNKWAFISPLFVSEYRCLLSSFDCSELFRGHIVVDGVVSAELADVLCSKCRLNFNTPIEYGVTHEDYQGDGIRKKKTKTSTWVR